MKLEDELLDLVVAYLVSAGLHQVNKGMSFSQKFALSYAAGKAKNWVVESYSQSIFEFLEDMAIASATRNPDEVRRNRAKRIAEKILADNKIP